MRKPPVICFIFFLGCLSSLSAQQLPLPVISVKNINNKIIVSWVNNYTRPVTTLNIQRSYDSLKNYSTIGGVLSPQSIENGYVDANPPYNKMYYRVFVAFEGGSYVITPSARPVKDLTVTDIVTERYPWMGEQGKDSLGIFYPSKIINPSARIFTARDNNVVIHLPEAAAKKYTVKFFDENEKFLFELTKLKEEYLILEKVNFVRPGWFRFEIYENGELIENNKFQIVKEVKKL
ncbi:MAG: hypothetical protein WKF88_11815 [Ferruginibacter sp.]